MALPKDREEFLKAAFAAILTLQTRKLKLYECSDIGAEMHRTGPYAGQETRALIKRLGSLLINSYRKREHNLICERNPTLNKEGGTYVYGVIPATHPFTE